MASAAEPAPARYFPALDGVRLFACLFVVLSHAFGEKAISDDVHHPLHAFVMDIGKTGVDVFFSLSGFLITTLLLAERRESGHVDLKGFYMRRTLRIWPVYYVALALAYGGAALVGRRWLSAFAGQATPALWAHSLPAYLTFMGNWLEGTVGPPTTVTTLWSVCVEEQFYILFPILFVFSKRQHPVFRVGLIGILISCVVRYWMACIDGPIMHNTFAHAENLLAGALLAQYAHARPAVLPALFKPRALALELAAIAGLLAFNQWDNKTIQSPLGWLLFYPTSALATTSVIAVFAFAGGPIGALLARARVRFLGQLTYAGYAFHMYALAMVWVAVRHLHLGAWSSGVVRALLAIPLTLAIAWLCRVTFELRFLRLKERWRPAAARLDVRGAA